MVFSVSNVIRITPFGVGTWNEMYDLLVNLSLHTYCISIRLLIDQLLNPFPTCSFHILAHTSYEHTVPAPSRLFDRRTTFILTGPTGCTVLFDRSISYTSFT